MRTLYHSDGILWPLGRLKQCERCIIVTAYCDISEGWNNANVVSKWRHYVTSRKVGTKRTLCHSDGILWRHGRLAQYERCIIVTAYCDVAEVLHKANVVSKWRHIVTSRKIETLWTLYHSDGILWRLGRLKQCKRCIIMTAYCDLSEGWNNVNVVS